MASNQTKDGKTSIQVRYKTRERIKKRGYKGQSYDEILTELLNEYEELHAAREQLREETGYYDDE